MLAVFVVKCRSVWDSADVTEDRWRLQLPGIWGIAEHIGP